MRHMVVILVVAALLGGCARTSKEAAPDEKERHRRTVWTDRTELFMEYDEPTQGGRSVFLLHLTTLGNFKPLIDATLNLTFTPEQGEAFTVTVDKPEKPGVFRVEASFTQPGSYTMTASVKGKAFSDEMTVSDIDVVGTEREQREGHHAEEPRSDISFLKEQQWTVDFMVGLPTTGQVSSSFIATGEVVPVADAEVTLSAPLSGNLSLSKPLPHAGSRISKNDVIAVIEPPVSLQGGIGSLTASHAEARSRVVLAQKEYERAQRLYEAKAVPKRRLEEAEIGLESAKAAFEPLDRAVQEVKPGSPGGRVVVRAPFGGTVVELFAANGKAIDGGQPILRLINTSTVWLKASVPATEIGSLGNLDKASFTIPGIEGEMKPSRLVTVNDMVDQKTRTVAVIFEVANNAGKLKVGMFADVSIKTGRAENALTIPDEALFEDEGRYFLFVQKGGESFERREVKTGTRGGGVVQVLSGLAKDERVVLRGGYYVKLASLTSRMSDPHAGHGH